LTAHKRLILLAALLGLLIVLSTALAHAEDGYDLSWWTVDGGGQSFSSDGRYSLGGTSGQCDAGILEGGDYTLVGGFWSGAKVEYLLCLPLALRNYQEVRHCMRAEPCKLHSGACHG
jgi:hypothetical protein